MKTKHKNNTQCDQCGKECFRPVHSLLRSKNVFCSRECNTEHQRMPDIELICSMCKKPFMRSLAKHNASSKICGKNYQPLCSHACVAGRNRSRDKRQHTKCDQCGKQIVKKAYEISKTLHNFCSRQCAATYSVSRRKKLGPYRRKRVKCASCGKKILAKSIKRKLCKTCKSQHMIESDKRRGVRAGLKCLQCKTPLMSRRKYCDECYPAINRMQLAKMRQTQVRRSKNESLFAEMVKQDYQDVLTNEAIFHWIKRSTGTPGNPWDADVILTRERVAILWNGIWHYKKVMRTQSLKQIRARDRIKMSVIRKNGYTPYVIKDMGSHSKKKVRREYKKFVLFMAKRKETAAQTSTAVSV